MTASDRPETRFATRAIFLIAGFGIACWAPLVPFAKQRLGVNDGTLGVLLLCLGIGSIVAMVTASSVAARFGSRPVIIVGALGLAITLPFLTIAGSPLALAATLAVFGAALGSVDVAMNIHAVEVQKAASRPLLSGFHAMYSIGGFIGPLCVLALFSVGLTPFPTTLVCSSLMLITLAVAHSGLIQAIPAENAPLFAVPRGIVLLLSILAAISYLVEGAVLDWSALLLTTRKIITADQSGTAYMCFAIAMTLGRVFGDRAVAKLGDRAILVGGGVLAIGGLAIVLLSPSLYAILPGFMAAGLGLANVVPVLFKNAGLQTVMPSNLAVAALTMIAYAGVLVGPAGIGFVADHVGLSNSFWLLAILLCAIPLTARIAAR